MPKSPATRANNALQGPRIFSLLPRPPGQGPIVTRLAVLKCPPQKPSQDDGHKVTRPPNCAGLNRKSGFAAASSTQLNSTSYALRHSVSIAVARAEPPSHGEQQRRRPSPPHASVISPSRRRPHHHLHLPTHLVQRQQVPLHFIIDHNNDKFQ